jgi:hypothetical protein
MGILGDETIEQNYAAWGSSFHCFLFAPGADNFYFCAKKSIFLKDGS